MEYPCACQDILSREQRQRQSKLPFMMYPSRMAGLARGVPGKIVTLARVRGEILSQTDGTSVLVTIHPLYLLRIQSDAGEAEKAEAYHRFVQDLRVGTKAWHVGFESKETPDRDELLQEQHPMIRLCF